MALFAGSRATASDFAHLTVANHAPLDSGTTTSTTYTTTRSSATSPVGVAFVAPPSSKVKIHWACGLIHNTTNATLCSFQIQEGSVLGSGTVVWGAGDARALQNVGTSERQAGRTSLVTGLTVGAEYNVTLMYRITAATTGTITRVEVIVDPCIS